MCARCPPTPHPGRTQAHSIASHRRRHRSAYSFRHDHQPARGVQRRCLAIIITIMVLELRVAARADAGRAAPLAAGASDLRAELRLPRHLLEQPPPHVPAGPTASTAACCGPTCTCCSGCRCSRSPPPGWARTDFARAADGVYGVILLLAAHRLLHPADGDQAETGVGSPLPRRRRLRRQGDHLDDRLPGHRAALVMKITKARTTPYRVRRCGWNLRFSRSQGVCRESGPILRISYRTTGSENGASGRKVQGMVFLSHATKAFRGSPGNEHRHGTADIVTGRDEQGPTFHEAVITLRRTSLFFGQRFF